MEKQRGEGMNQEEIIKLLKEVTGEVEQKYKARIKGIFGSFVRGEEREKSDIDILVEFEEGANLLHLVGLSLFLEDKINMPVDLVPSDTLRKEIREDILKEAIYL
jgi:predicted nucleotidyltransferase